MTPACRSKDIGKRYEGRKGRINKRRRKGNRWERRKRGEEWPPCLLLSTELQKIP